MVLVGTTASDHHALDGLAKPLTADFTVYNYDRRGRGDSGDVQPYAPAREVEDLAALLGAVGRPASLVSGSAGCVLALDAASALGERVAALYLYEPPFIVGPGRPPVPATTSSGSPGWSPTATATRRWRSSWSRPSGCRPSTWSR